MDRLQKISKRMQGIVLILIALTPCGVALSVLTGEWAQLVDAPAHFPLDETRIHGAGLVVIVALGLLKPLAYMWAFWAFYRALQLYRQGMVFTAVNVEAMRKIGWALVLIDIAAMARTTLAGPVLKVFEITSGYISIAPEVGFIAVGGLMILVAHVMDLGRELKERDDLVI